MSVTLLLGAGNVTLRRFRISVDLLLAICMLVQEMAKQCYLLRLDIKVTMYCSLLIMGPCGLLIRSVLPVQQHRWHSHTVKALLQ